GYEFSAAPTPDGKPISGYGWIEDQSCFTNGVYIDTYCQVLAGQSRSTPTVNVDGYFTEYPENSTIMLRRTKNGQPSMLMYEHGAGRVILAGMYTDWASGNGQASPEEIALVRDLVSWAKDPVDLPEIKPGETVSLTFSLMNDTVVDPSSAKLQIYNPDRSVLLAEEVVYVVVQEGDYADTSLSYQTTTNSPLGIYHVDAILYDSEDNEITSQTDVTMFVVSNPPVNPYKTPDFNFSVNSDAENYLSGSDAEFTITMYNRTDAERTITAKFFFPHHFWETGRTEYGGDWSNRHLNITERITIPPNGSTLFNHTLHNASSRGDRLWAYFYDENDKQVGLATRGFRAYMPSVNVDVKTDKAVYDSREDNIYLNLNMQNRQNVAYKFAVNVNIFDPANYNVYSNDFEISLDGYSTALESLSFNPPENAKSGFYSVLVDAYDSKGSKIGGASANFELPKAVLSIVPVLPESLSQQNNFTFRLDNVGYGDVETANLTVTLLNHGGIKVWEGNRTLSDIRSGEGRNVDFSVSIPAPEFGDYKLSYIVNYAGDTKSGEEIIPNLVAISSLVSDKTSYRIRETANLTVNLMNVGKFDLDNLSVELAIPDANYREVKATSLSANADNKAIDFTVNIPEFVNSGYHNVNVILTLPSGSSIERTSVIAVPTSSLGVKEVEATTAGSSIGVLIENTGGVDTQYNLDVTVEDISGHEIYSGNLKGSIKANEEKLLSDLQLPSQIVKGYINSFVKIKDLTTEVESSFSDTININGLHVEMTTQTDKPEYLITESITAFATINNNAFDITEGVLDLKVKKKDRKDFIHFLPNKNEKWPPMYGPRDVAFGPDGSVYVVDFSYSRIHKYDRDGHFIMKWGSRGSGDGKLGQPMGIAVDSDGYVYVSDNYRIQKFDSNGTFIMKWGSLGSDDGQFRRADRIAVSADNYIYVLDRSNYRIQKFDSNGTFITKWGSRGNEDGQFSEPRGIAVAPDGSVYVVNGYGYGVQKFDSDGNFIMKWGSSGYGNGQLNSAQNIAVDSKGYVFVLEGGYNYSGNRVQKFDGNGNFITKWGYKGTGDGGFQIPYGIDVDSNGDVLVADTNNSRMQMFDNNGQFIKKWGSSGTGDGEFINPDSVAIAPDGSIYVTDPSIINSQKNNRVQKFDSSGNFVTKWGSYGAGDGQFKRPQGIAVGPDGSVYVADNYNNRIQKFDGNGNFITKWGSLGDGDGEFKYPWGVAVDDEGYVYVSDSSNSRIQKFDSNGNFVTKWGSYGRGDDQFRGLRNMIVGSSGYIYVVDFGNRAIKKFDRDGNFILKWGKIGYKDGEFRYPYGIAIDDDEYVYISDWSENTIQKFDSNGAFIDKWFGYGDDDGQFMAPHGMAYSHNGILYVADEENNRIQMMDISKGNELFFEKTFPVNQSANTEQEYIANVGVLDAKGKLHLEVTLTNNLNQIVAKDSYPFYIVEGDIVLRLNPDKKYYKPGETVTISGEVKNLTGVTASTLSVQAAAGYKNIYSEVFDVSANGSQYFTVTTVAGSVGEVFFSGKVTQNNTALVNITDQYTIDNPALSVTVLAPEIVGADPFVLALELKNDGKVETGIELFVRSSENVVIDSQHVVVPAGETKLLQYSQEITSDTTYTINFSGDLTKSVTRSVKYGEAVNIAFGNHSSTINEVFAEGVLEIPVTVTNTGQLDEEVTVSYNLSDSGNNQITQASRSYYLPVGSSISDTLHYKLSKGDYQVLASSSEPSVWTQKSFKVVSTDDATISVEAGDGNALPVPVTIGITNNGWNTLDGRIELSVMSETGNTVWREYREVIEVKSGEKGSYSINVDPAGINPGDYMMKAALYNNGGEEISAAMGSISIAGANLTLVTIPDYRTFNAGEEGNFTFNIRNTGNQEGEARFTLRVMDILDQTVTEWLKPGEEKDMTFAFILADDLEDKDYFADYDLKDESDSVIDKGQVKFHVAGINIDVAATLDKDAYKEGETAQFTLAVTNRNQTAESVNLFARVNYAGYDEQQPFTLTDAKTLTFNVPVNAITGEKLFYGIYHEAGRSIHLNTLYIRDAGDVVTIMTDKQVYEPGETVSLSIDSAKSGQMTLTGPGDFNEVFTFDGSATQSFVLPSIMSAGTYYIDYSLSVGEEKYEGFYTIDVKGIEVKVLEAGLDKGKYASEDTIIADLKISSNWNVAAVMKTSIVDSQGNYTDAGNEPLNLSSDEPLLVTLSRPFTTDKLGIHKFVYSIFTEDETLILSSGIEAFDVGDAELLGISLGKSDYPTISEPVIITLDLYGTTMADIELFVDEQLVRTETVILDGFNSKTINIDPGEISPGNHKLKAVLRLGDLVSSKEIDLIYGSSLPDLVVHNFTMASEDQGYIVLAATVTNQGKVESGATTLTFYDGNPENGGVIIGIVDVPSIPAGDSVTVTYSWNLMGFSGGHNIFAVVADSSDVYEFNTGNNRSATELEVPEVNLSIKTTQSSYEANTHVGIVEEIVNLTASQSFNNVVLETVVIDSFGIVRETIADNIASFSPGKNSFTNTWNTTVNPAGIYSIEATLKKAEVANPPDSGNVLAETSTRFEILPTISVYGDMTLSSGEVIQDFPLDINCSLTNDGNVDIIDGSLTVSVTNKNNNMMTTLGTSSLAPINLSDTLSVSMVIDRVNVEPGEYTVLLEIMTGGKVIEIASKDLIVKPPLKMTKSISILPRVLVWSAFNKGNVNQDANPQPSKDEIIARAALDQMGAYYRVVHSEAELIEGMRSDYYNTFALVDTGGPATGTLMDELIERVRGGDTLILTSQSNVDEIKVTEVTGTKFTGYLNSAIRTVSTGMPIYDEPSAITIADMVQKLEVTSGQVEIAGVISSGNSNYPVVTVNSYGDGRAILLAFDLGQSAEALQDTATYASLLKDVIAFAAPSETDIVPATVLPVEITVESLGSAFDLRIEAAADGMTILDANNNGVLDTLSNKVTWNTQLAENKIIRLVYLAALPEFNNLINAEADVYYLYNGEERLYNSYSLSIAVHEGTIDLQNRIINALNSLVVPNQESGIKDSIIRNFEKITGFPSMTRQDIERDIHELLKLIDDLEKLSTNANAIRSDMGDMLQIMQRRWLIAP
ncbi:MAG: SMP-30/gluconolactonase/LRE family protein, partial [Proteobacteria bacterium]|nr:SMP-30/gluconolactonase/LRE family protein [Pseudomonadota bacterium]